MEINGADPRVGPDAAGDVPLTGAARDVAQQSSNPQTRRQTSTTGSPTGRRRKARKIDVAAASPSRLGAALRLTLSVILIVGGFVGIAAFRLSRGPISLAAFKTAIEASISAELGGNQFFVRDAELALGDDGLEIALLDIRITDPRGTALVQAPRAVVGVSGQAALRGQFAFSRLDLVSPRLQIFYSPDGTLSVAFTPAADTSAPDTSPRSDVTDKPLPNSPPLAVDDAAGAIDFVKAITDVSAQARRREHVTAYMREIGLRQMTVIVDNGRRKTIWRVPEVKLDLSHKASRSLIVGRATIDSLTGPWSLDFQTAEIAGLQQLAVQAKVTGVNPRGLSRQIISLAAFEHVDVPLDGEARFELSSKGVVSGATFALTARPGWIQTTASGQRGGRVEAAAINGSYDAATANFAIKKASLSVDGNRLDLTGNITRAATLTLDKLPLWNFDLSSTDGALAPTQPGAKPITIEQFRARGQLVPEQRNLLLQEVTVKAGGAAISATGRFNDLATEANRTADLEARIAPMPIAQLLAFWPSTLQPEARSWLAQHLIKGQLNSGTVKLAATGDNRISLALEIANTELAAVQGMPPFVIPRGLVRLEGGGLEITVPDASIGTEGKRLLLKGLRMTAVETADGSPPTGEVAFRLLGPLAAVVDLADREPYKILKSRGIALGVAEGRIDGQFKLTLPIADDVQPSDIRVEGRARLTDGRLRQALGPHDITGAKIDIEISDTAIDGRGDFLVKGVPVKIAGQYFSNTTPDRQSPIRLTLKLDDADRAQLGLDINDLVAGEVPIEITIAQDAKGEYQARLDADLTKSELTLDSVAYRKPPGSPARVQFEVNKAPQGRVELRNFKIAGDSIAAEGMIVLGPDGKARELSFPDFSLNTVSRLDVQGHLRPDHIWEVRAKGATFDGRELFRDMFNVQNQSKPVSKDKPGLDLSAQIDTVIGFNETNLKAVRLTLQKRSDNGIERTTSLDVTASHETAKSFEARIRSQRNGERNLVATSEDAGQIFRVVGFYPNASGGRMNLELALEGRVAIERNGILKAERFVVLGDAIVSEVFQNSDGPAAGDRSARKKVTRERIDFDWMVLPFSVGCGQFVMNDVEIRGPLIGARARGKADFKSQRLQIGGTYIPLSGLNSALGGLPVLGQLLAGPKGEGIFGITFAVQGPMANPEVLVNPLSGIVPGILRETQQLTPESYKITPCNERPPTPPKIDAARASSTAPQAAGTSAVVATPRAAKPDVITDWTSDAKSPKQR